MKQPIIILVLVLLSGAAGSQERPTLDLEALVREAIQRHPQLRSARRSAAAAWQVPPRVGSMPDPTFMVAVRNFRIDRPGLTTDSMSGVELGLAQDLPFPGKLRRRSAVAGAEAQAADREVGLTQAAVALRVRRAYWELFLAEQAERITSENEKVLDTVTEIVITRFTLGQVAQQDAYQAQVAQSRVRAQLEERKQAAVSARRGLNSAVGRPPNADLPPTSAPPEPPALDRDQALRAAQERSPSVALDRARAVAAQRAVSEATWDRWPDFQLGAGFMFRGVVPGDPTSGTDMFGVSLGLTLPVWLWRKQNARVRETRQLLGAAEANVDASLLEATTELQMALDAIERLDREIVLYRNDVIPQADRALVSSTADYQVGKTTFVSLLQNWQALLDAQLDLERLRAERAERLAAVRALTGEDTP
jgi:outer membrane protein TolC